MAIRNPGAHVSGVSQLSDRGPEWDATAVDDVADRRGQPPLGRRWLRTLILFFVMGPFFLLVGWTSTRWAFQGPEYWRRRLQSDLAMSVEWRELTSGSPYRRHFQDVKFRDCEQGMFLGSARSIDSLALPDQHQVTLSFATLNRKQIPRIARLLHDRFCQQPWLLDREWRLEARQLRLIDSQHAMPSCDASLHVQRCNGCPNVRLQLSFVDMPPDRPLIADWKRTVRNDRVSSEIDVNANDHPLPGNLLRAGRPWESALRPDSHFQGNCWIDVVDGIWDYDVVGTLGPIDLAPLGRTALHHDAGGTASVRIAQAFFHHDELRQLDCFVIAGPGTISGRALEVLARMLGARVANEIEELAGWQDRSFAFERLAFRLTAGSGRLLVTAANTESKVIISRGTQSILEVHHPPQPGDPQLLSRLFAREPQ